MKNSWYRGLALATLLAAETSAASIELVGKTTVPGSLSDLSGLGNTISWPHTAPTNSISHSQFGGWGSAITYSGSGNLFVVTPDRGPGDGLVSEYFDRYHTVELTVDPNTQTIGYALKQTRLLTDEAGNNLVGQSRAFGSRFDPEGVRAGKDGTLFVSDEYGPHIYQFDQSGKRVKTIDVPDKFSIANPSELAANELSGNIVGRQANRGMEGLAISPDGRYLFGIMQSPLLQDGGLNDQLQRRGIYNRILRVDLETGATSEFVYEMARRQHGVSEILAINDHEFLVLERDGDAGANAEYKLIYRIDVTNATDVSSITLPQNGALPQGVQAAQKDGTPFIDLLDGQFGLAGASFPEKIEGLAWGPQLADGRLTLWVTSDNDFLDTPSSIYAFAIEQDVLNYQAQQIDTPFTGIPEPWSCGLVASGLLALCWKRRSRGF